jgi:hypothetical protein
MANLAQTAKRAAATTGDNIVPAHVLIDMRRQRAERQRRVAATIACTSAREETLPAV